MLYNVPVRLYGADKGFIHWLRSWGRGGYSVYMGFPECFWSFGPAFPNISNKSHLKKSWFNIEKFINVGPYTKLKTLFMLKAYLITSFFETPHTLPPPYVRNLSYVLCQPLIILRELMLGCQWLFCSKKHMDLSILKV